MTNVFETVCEKSGWDCSGDRAVISLPEGRSQVVFRDMTQEDGEEIMRIYSAVGSVDALDEQRMRSALSINFRLRNGALAIREGNLVMVDTFLLREADQDEVRLAIEYLAKTADHYEKLIYGADQH